MRGFLPSTQKPGTQEHRPEFHARLLNRNLDFQPVPGRFPDKSLKAMGTYGEALVMERHMAISCLETVADFRGVFALDRDFGGEI